MQKTKLEQEVNDLRTKLAATEKEMEVAVSLTKSTSEATVPI